MTYTNAEKLIKCAKGTDSADNLGKLLGCLGNPEKKLGIIKIFGGSGKSSVCTMLSAVLSAAGYKVGRLTTPLIHSVPNNIRIYEKPTSIEFFTKSADKVNKILLNIKKSDEEYSDLAFSANDLLFATALTAFADADCDYALIEVPTENISHTVFSSPIISIISTSADVNIAKSICARLDRDSKEVITAIQSREVYKLISDKCAEINTRLSMPLKNAFLFMSATVKHAEFTYGGKVFTVGCGSYYQVQNMLTVLEAVAALKRCGLKIAGTDVCSAVLSEGIPLRFEVISILPTIIIDRADTKERRNALIESLKKLDSQISVSPIVICDGDRKNISEEFFAAGYRASLNEANTKELKKSLREILPNLDESSTLIILGSSKYCEEASKHTREFLM